MGSLLLAPCSFVVRFTNKDVVCQIVYATLAGDRIVASAYRCGSGAQELKSDRSIEMSAGWVGRSVIEHTSC